jgi:hypothetical protein
MGKLLWGWWLLSRTLGGCRRRDEKGSVLWPCDSCGFGCGFGCGEAGGMQGGEGGSAPCWIPLLQGGGVSIGGVDGNRGWEDAAATAAVDEGLQVRPEGWVGEDHI